MTVTSTSVLKYAYGSVDGIVLLNLPPAKFGYTTPARNVITLTRRGAFSLLSSCVQFYSVEDKKSIKVPLDCFNSCTCTHLIFTPW